MFIDSVRGKDLKNPWSNMTPILSSCICQQLFIIQDLTLETYFSTFWKVKTISFLHYVSMQSKNILIINKRLIWCVADDFKRTSRKTLSVSKSVAEELASMGGSASGESDIYHILERPTSSETSSQDGALSRRISPSRRSPPPSTFDGTFFSHVRL